MRIKTSIELDRRILHDAVEAFEGSKKKETVELKPGFRRIMMQNKLAQLAASVVVVIGVVMAIYLFRGSDVAWAKVAQKVEQMKTCFSHTRITYGEIPSEDRWDYDSDELVMYISKDQGIRLDKFKKNILVQKQYLRWNDKVFIFINPGSKTYGRVQLKGTHGPLKSFLNPREYWKKLLARDYKKLKRKTINGIAAAGIEVRRIRNDGDSLDGVERHWVDIATELPVRTEFEGKMKTGKGFVTFHTVDDYRWNVEFADNIFQPEIPPDYSLLESRQK